MFNAQMKRKELEMTPTKFVAYYRVSTDRQGLSGLGLEAQRSSVAQHINGGELVAEFTEVESGRKSDRPQLLAALAAAKRAKAVLVIAKLDRLARNVHFISGLLESGVPFVCADMPEADRTWLQMSAVFAEWEARKISERTKSALQAAKARGVRLGSPDPAKGSAAGIKRIQARSEAFAARINPIINNIKSQGITSLRDIAQALSDRGVQTARGNTEWHASQVANIIRLSF
jgi:DNA invertase Pin-like site-specific DNA recombinase